MAKKQHNPEPEILALMGEQVRKRLLYRKSKPVAREQEIIKNQENKPSSTSKSTPTESELREQMKNLDKQIREINEQLRVESEKYRRTVKSGRQPSKNMLDDLWLRVRQLRKQRQTTQAALSKEVQARKKQAKKTAPKKQKVRAKPPRNEKLIGSGASKRIKPVSESLSPDPKGFDRTHTDPPLGIQSPMTPAAPIEQPPYWGKCKKMDFGQLRQVIDNSLKRLSEPDPNDRPRSKEEFLNLLEMLRGKLNASDLPEILPDPGDSTEFPPFVPSEQLKSLLDQREQLIAKLHAASSNLSTKRSILKKLRYRLQLLQRDITTLENHERQDYEKHRDASLRSYKEAKIAHERSIQQWNAEVQKRIQFHSRRLQIVERVGNDIERAFRFEATLPPSRISWRVLPPGKLSVDDVLQHHARLQQQKPHIKYERERITKALSLHPKQCYVGEDEFEGYIVFTFAHTPQALLECPKFGNAIYIINSDWAHWSKMTKHELLASQSREVTKIVHKGNWFRRVKRELGIG